MILSVIISNYNGGELLDKCIYYLKKALPRSSEIIVVDNGSVDKSVELLRILKKKGVRVIRNKKNVGFAGASNQGARAARGRYLLFLNNDCFVEKHAISRMLAFLYKNKSYCATQPVVLSRDGAVENIGYWIDRTRGKALTVTEICDLPFPKKLRFFDYFLYGLSATCLLMRRADFIKIGMFDESFHSYLEDVDLFIRLQVDSYQFYPTLSAKVSHIHMATSSKKYGFKQKQDFKNWLRIIHKNYKGVFARKSYPGLIIERFRNFNGIIKGW